MAWSPGLNLRHARADRGNDAGRQLARNERQLRLELVAAAHHHQVDEIDRGRAGSRAAPRRPSARASACRRARRSRCRRIREPRPRACGLLPYERLLGLPAHRQRRDAALRDIVGDGALEHLAVRRQRNLVERQEILRHVELRQAGRVEMRQQLVRRDALAGAEHHGEADLLAEPRVLHRHGGGALHGGVPRRQFLDPRRMDVVAAADDDVLAAAGDAQIAVLRRASRDRRS